jgi:hypothetical protein
MKNSKSPFMAPVLVALAFSVALLSSPAPASIPGQEERTTAGVLAGWRLDMDGTVYLQIRGQGEEQALTWFRTPADKSMASRNVEEMLIGAVLIRASRSAEQVLTVTAKHERALDGEDPEHALPLLSVSSP